jgi:hypothetical protein
MAQGAGDATLDEQPDDTGDDEADLEDRLWLAARGQKMAIHSIILNFVLRSVEKSQVLPDLLPWLFFAVTVYALVGVVKICSGLGKSQNQKILFMVLSFVPLVNLVVLIYLSIKTTRLLRDAGWEVGLMGARL